MNRPLRVAIVTGLFPPAIGGPATYLWDLCHALQERGHTCLVVTLSPAQRSEAFSVFTVPRWLPVPLRWCAILHWLLRLHRRYDVLFTHGGPWDSGLPAVLAKHLLRKPLVTKVTGDIAWERARIRHLTEDSIEQFQHRRYPWRVEFFRTFQQRIIRQVDTVMVPSQSLQRLVAGWGIPVERMRVIPNGVRLAAVDALPSRAEARRRVQVRGPLLVAAGRLVPWKRFDQAIETLRQHAAADAELFIVGEGPERSRLERVAAALGVAARVRFVGPVTRAELWRYLRAADLLVHPSEYEGCPHLLLEAMAAGTPFAAKPVEAGWTFDQTCQATVECLASVTNGHAS